MKPNPTPRTSTVRFIDAADQQDQLACRNLPLGLHALYAPQRQAAGREADVAHYAQALRELNPPIRVGGVAVAIEPLVLLAAHQRALNLAAAPTATRHPGAASYVVPTQEDNQCG